MTNIKAKVVEQKNKDGIVKLKIEYENIDTTEVLEQRWFNFEPVQVKDGRWKKHVELYKEKLQENLKGADDVVGTEI